MADALTSEDSGSGEAAAEDGRPLKSRREQAAHDRNYVAQIRTLAAGERE
jgi:hypothetical protein